MSNCPPVGECEHQGRPRNFRVLLDHPNTVTVVQYRVSCGLIVEILNEIDGTIQVLRPQGVRSQ